MTPETVAGERLRMHITHIDTTPIDTLNYRSGIARGGVKSMPLYRGYVNVLPDDIEAIFLTSDLQGREIDETRNRLAGEFVAEELAALAEAGRAPAPSKTGVVLAGDLFCPTNPAKLGGYGDVRAVWQAFANRFAWVVGVLGNHDILGGKIAERRSFAQQANIRILDTEMGPHGGSDTLGGLRIAGVGGAIGAPGDKRLNRRSEANFLAAVEYQLQQRPDLLVTHQHPFLSSTRRPGSRGYSELLEQHDGVVAFGHNRTEALTVKFGPHCDALCLDSRAFLLQETS